MNSKWPFVHHSQDRWWVVSVLLWDLQVALLLLHNSSISSGQSVLWWHLQAHPPIHIQTLGRGLRQSKTVPVCVVGTCEGCHSAAEGNLCTCWPVFDQPLGENTHMGCPQESGELSLLECLEWRLNWDFEEGLLRIQTHQSLHGQYPCSQCRRRSFPNMRNGFRWRCRCLWSSAVLPPEGLWGEVVWMGAETHPSLLHICARHWTYWLNRLYSYIL